MMDCPNCDQTDLRRDSVDNGIAVQYGPYGCECGWSEWPEYDRTSGTCEAQRDHPGGVVDQWGGVTPSSKPVPKATTLPEGE